MVYLLNLKLKEERRQKEEERRQKMILIKAFSKSKSIEEMAKLLGISEKEIEEIVSSDE